MTFVFVAYLPISKKKKIIGSISSSVLDRELFTLTITVVFVVGMKKTEDNSFMYLKKIFEMIMKII